MWHKGSLEKATRPTSNKDVKGVEYSSALGTDQVIRVQTEEVSPWWLWRRAFSRRIHTSIDLFGRSRGKRGCGLLDSSTLE